MLHQKVHMSKQKVKHCRRVPLVIQNKKKKSQSGSSGYVLFQGDKMGAYTFRSQL